MRYAQKRDAIKISFVIASTGRIVSELIPLVSELLARIRQNGNVEGQVVLVTQYDVATEEELKNLLAEKYCEITHVNIKEKIGYFSKFNFALQKDSVANSDICVFANDDIVIPSDFLETIRKIISEHGLLCAPLIYGPNGEIQLSVFRKDYSKFSMFFRKYDEGLYSRLAKFLRILDTNMESLNRDRYTVFGCCFIMNNAAITQMHRFDDNIFLYYEEVFLLAMVRKFNWECKVLTNLCINHRGGATTTKKFTLDRALMDKKAAIYVAKKYLGFNPVQLLILRAYKWCELCTCLLVNLFLKSFPSIPVE